MAEKAFTIQKTKEAVIEQFHAFRNEKGLTPAAYLEQLVNNQINPVNIDDLQPKVEELKTSLQDLQQVNENLQADKLSLETSLQTSNENYNKLRALYDELNEELNELKNKEPQPTGIILKDNEFICSPSDEALQLSRKYRPFLKKDGVFTGTDADYPNFLFNTAVTKYIKNKYE